MKTRNVIYILSIHALRTPGSINMERERGHIIVTSCLHPTIIMAE